MTDIVNKELLEGDSVAFNPPFYKGLTKAKIIGFTPKMVKLEYFHQGRKEITRTEPFNVVKI